MLLCVSFLNRKSSNNNFIYYIEEEIKVVKNCLFWVKIPDPKCENSIKRMAIDQLTKQNNGPPSFTLFQEAILFTIADELFST